MNKEVLLKNYLSNLQVEVDVASYVHCPQNWREIDYVPGYNKFYWIRGGQGWLKIGNEEYYPKPGQLFIMPAGVLQSYSTISKNTFRKYWCHFIAKIGDVNLFDIIHCPVFVDVGNDHRLEKLFGKLICNMESSQFTSIIKRKAALIEIISYFLDNTNIESIFLSTSPSVDKLNHVLSYIEDNLSDNINIETLAQIVHFHPNYFIKFFRDHLGCSPIKYINRTRVEKAKYLLKNTSLTIKEIADKIGFNDSSYFSKTFKKYTDLSPLEFRNRISSAILLTNKKQ